MAAGPVAAVPPCRSPTMRVTSTEAATTTAMAAAAASHRRPGHATM
jgi:hypothetical protein